MNNIVITEQKFLVFSDLYNDIIEYINQNFDIVLYWYNLTSELRHNNSGRVSFFHDSHVFSDKEDIKIVEITNSYLTFSYEYSSGHCSSCRDYYNPEFQLPAKFFTNLEEYIQELKDQHDKLVHDYKEKERLKDLEKVRQRELAAIKKQEDELNTLRLLKEKYESNK